MYDDLLRCAYEKSDAIIKKVIYKLDDEFVPLKEIIKAVENKLGCNIEGYVSSFNEIIGANESVKKAGAMLFVKCNDNHITYAKILINGDKDSVFQRLSLVHELGLLMITENPLELCSNNNYIASPYISDDITSIEQNDYSSDRFILKEQLANVFALRVLVPCSSFYCSIKKLNDIAKVATIFGVSRNAVLSRIMLVE